METEKEEKTIDEWDAQRILYGYIYYSDEKGYLTNVDDLDDSSYKIYRQRFYAALRTYGKDPEQFYCPEHWKFRDVCRHLLSRTRSEEKMNEFWDLVKQHLGRNVSYDYSVKYADTPEFLSEMSVSLVFCKLMEYRKKLYAIEDIWSGVLECSRYIGMIYNVTNNLTHENIKPMCQIIDRMLILLMGDNYDKTFMVEELYQYGYPTVSDKELHDMEMEEW